MPVKPEALRERYRTDEAYRARIAAYKRVRRERNPERVRELDRAAYQRQTVANPEKVKANAYERTKRAYERLRVENPELIKERAKRQWANMSPELRRERREKRKERHFTRQAEIAGRPRPDICDICGGNRIRIVFDHCHNTDKFRGWICSPCNTVLGLMNDNADLLRRLADYLDNPASYTPVAPIA